MVGSWRFFASSRGRYDAKSIHFRQISYKANKEHSLFGAAEGYLPSLASFRTRWGRSNCDGVWPTSVHLAWIRHLPKVAANSGVKVSNTRTPLLGPHASTLYFYISNVNGTQHPNFARFKFSSSTGLDAHIPAAKSHKALCRRYPFKQQKEFPYAETT